MVAEDDRIGDPDALDADGAASTIAAGTSISGDGEDRDQQRHPDRATGAHGPGKHRRHAEQAPSSTARCGAALARARARLLSIMKSAQQGARRTDRSSATSPPVRTRFISRPVRTMACRPGPALPRPIACAPRIETEIAIDIAGELRIAHDLIDRAIGRGGVRAEAVDEAEQHQFGERYHHHADRASECRAAARFATGQRLGRIARRKVGVRKPADVDAGEDGNGATTKREQRSRPSTPTAALATPSMGSRTSHGSGPGLPQPDRWSKPPVPAAASLCRRRRASSPSIRMKTKSAAWRSS